MQRTERDREGQRGRATDIASVSFDNRVAAVAMEFSGCSGGALDPLASGRALHAGFLALLGQVDPGLADRLHKSQGAKPFTVALLPASGNSASRAAPAAIILRVTSLDSALSNLLLDEAAWPRRILRVRSVEARIGGVTTCASAQALCGTKTYAELASEGMARARGGEALSLGLDFVTPTMFRLAESSLMMPLPWPHLVFQSLEQRWNAFACDGIWINWPIFDRCISIARHTLQTAVVDLGAYRQVGFVGNVEYIADREAPRSLIEAVHILGEFARYAGVGAKTTMGMGVAAPFDPRAVHARRTTRKCALVRR